MRGIQVRWFSRFDGVERTGRVVDILNGVAFVETLPGEVWSVLASTVRAIG